MKRKRYSKDNQIHGRLPTRQYKTLLKLASDFNCTKIKVIRYLLTDYQGPHQTDLSLPKQRQMNDLKRSNNIVSDGLNLIHDDLYRIGNLINQAVRNQNTAKKYGRPFNQVSVNLIKKTDDDVLHIKLLINHVRKEVK